MWQAEDEGFAIYAAAGRLQAGEALLLCSGGLTDGISAADLPLLWQEHEALLDKLESLRLAVRNSRLNPHFDDCSVVYSRRSEKVVQGGEPQTVQIVRQGEPTP